MCKDKMPIEALGLTHATERRLGHWLGNAHTVSAIDGQSFHTLRAAHFPGREITEIHRRLVRQKKGFVGIAGMPASG